LAYGARIIITGRQGGLEKNDHRFSRSDLI
jgi:hypothetical protein